MDYLFVQYGNIVATNTNSNFNPIHISGNNTVCNVINIRIIHTNKLLFVIEQKKPAKQENGNMHDDRHSEAIPMAAMTALPQSADSYVHDDSEAVLQMVAVASRFSQA